MVSIAMLTYNHEKYIRQALDGILKQKVNFMYEIVIGEDCSTDNTRNILLEYKDRNPNIIKLILHEKNVGMKENSNAILRQCIGKYCAICEGDDYWVDPYKLKQQVCFLENHPQYVGTTHKIIVVDKDGKSKSGKNLNIYCKDNIYTIRHAEQGILPGQSATLVYRNILANDPFAMDAIDSCNANFDMKIALYLALKGDIYCFNDVMSHYRWITTQGDSWSARTRAKNLNLYLFNSYTELNNLAERLKNTDMNYKNKYLNCAFGAFIAFLKHPSKENLKILLEIYNRYNNKLELVFYIPKKIIIYVLRKCGLKSLYLRFKE